MFFMRIRRHARWLFMFLAVLFALTFAFAGVGSGSTGVGDLMGSIGSVFGGSGGGSNPVHDAQKQVDKAGDDPAKLAAALHLLGKAQVAKTQYPDAEATYVRYLRLRPNDVQARQELAAVYKNDSDTYGNQLSSVVTDVVQSAPSPLNGNLVTDPIATGEHQDAVSTASEIYKKFGDPKDKELAALNTALAHAKGPLRASVLIQLAGEAYNATQVAATFGAYVPEAAAAADAQQHARRWAGYAVTADTALLKLHPHDTLTAQIKQQLAAVKPYAPASGK
jgi:hypothetical protein